MWQENQPNKRGSLIYSNYQNHERTRTRSLIRHHFEFWVFAYAPRTLLDLKTVKMIEPLTMLNNDNRGWRRQRSMDDRVCGTSTTLKIKRKATERR